MTTVASLPKTQYAVQLVGPGKLTLNQAKPVPQPGPHQILAKIECVGLCFSDLKLLKQFDQHARKSEITAGLSAEVLKEIPSYVPGGLPTVPGHEATCRILAVGDKVQHYQVGERCIVQADFRDLPTAASNAAFGYNFEGALQEYVLLDERVVYDQKNKERFLIPAQETLSASAVALVEPWACVEASYVAHERRHVKPEGKLLVVADAGHRVEGLADILAQHKPGHVTAICTEAHQREHLGGLVNEITTAQDLTSLPNEGYDDIIYFGASKATLDVLNDKLATRGLMNVVLGGRKIGQPVSVGIGRVHYGLTRWIGTTGSSAAESYHAIPETGEIRPNDRVVIIGAGGPMGQMHVIRVVSSGIPGLVVSATDMDDSRLDSLHKKAAPMAKANHVQLRMVNTKKTPLTEKFSYFALMAPVGALVADAVRDSAPRTLINIFAGIPAPVKQDLDLDAYIANQCYMFGTSGSEIRDMKIVLKKVESGQLDTNASVDAVTGMAGATDGIAAVENRTLAGKIIVYPMLHELGLTPLTKLKDVYPTVAAKLDDGKWCRAAEEELLKVAK